MDTVGAQEEHDSPPGSDCDLAAAPTPHKTLHGGDPTEGSSGPHGVRDERALPGGAPSPAGAVARINLIGGGFVESAVSADAVLVVRLGDDGDSWAAQRIDAALEASSSERAPKRHAAASPGEGSAEGWHSDLRDALKTPVRSQQQARDVAIAGYGISCESMVRERCRNLWDAAANTTKAPMTQAGAGESGAHHDEYDVLQWVDLDEARKHTELCLDVLNHRQDLEGDA